MQEYHFYVKQPGLTARYLTTIEATFVGTAIDRLLDEHQGPLSVGGVVVIVEGAAVHRDHPVVWVHAIDTETKTHYKLRAEATS